MEIFTASANRGVFSMQLTWDKKMGNHVGNCIAFYHYHLFNNCSFFKANTRGDAFITAILRKYISSFFKLHIMACVIYIILQWLLFFPGLFRLYLVVCVTTSVVGRSTLIDHINGDRHIRSTGFNLQAIIHSVLTETNNTLNRYVSQLTSSC